MSVSKFPLQILVFICGFLIPAVVKCQEFSYYYSPNQIFADMCYHPVPITFSTGKKIYVPCGHCLQCCQSYQNSVVARLTEESKCWTSGSVLFATLTYRDESLPYLHTYFTNRGFRQCLEHVDARKSFTRNHKSLFKVIDSYDDYESSIVRQLNSVVVGTSKGGVPFDLVLNRAIDFVNNSVIPSFYDGFDGEPFDSSNLIIPHADCFSLDSNGFLHEELSPLDEFILTDSKLSMPSVCLSDIQDWLKRCRSRYTRSCPDKVKSLWIVDDPTYPKDFVPSSFKYFYCSEYGSHFFRPHYHIVLFGVTLEDFKTYFEPDWNKYFGSVDVRVYDSRFGGLTYVSKYVSKSGFDNFYTNTYYHYPNGKFYYSKHFEYSIRDFHIDAPLAMPVFKHFSKGIGLSWLLQPRIAKLSSYKNNGVNFHQIDSEDIPVTQDFYDKVVQLESLSDVEVAIRNYLFYEPSTENFAINFLGLGRFQIVQYARKKGHPEYIDYDTAEVVPSLSDRLLFVSSCILNIYKVATAQDLANISSLKFNRKYFKSNSPYIRNGDVLSVTPSYSSFAVPSFYRKYIFTAPFKALRVASLANIDSSNQFGVGYVAFSKPFILPSGLFVYEGKQKNPLSSEHISETKLQHSCRDYYLSRED